MKIIRLLAMALVPVGILCAAPAAADETDDLYLIGLETESISLPPSDAISAAYAVCALIAKGATSEQLVMATVRRTGLGLADAGFLAGAAIYSYCPEYESAVGE